MQPILLVTIVKGSQKRQLFQMHPVSNASWPHAIHVHHQLRPRNGIERPNTLMNSCTGKDASGSPDHTIIISFGRWPIDMPQLSALPTLSSFSARQMKATVTRAWSRVIRTRRGLGVVSKSCKYTFLLRWQLRFIVQSHVFESLLFRFFRPLQLTRASKCRSPWTVHSRIKALPRGSRSVGTYWGPSGNVLANQISKCTKHPRGSLTNDLRYESNDSRDIENGSFSLSMLR